MRRLSRLPFRVLPNPTRRLSHSHRKMCTIAKVPPPEASRGKRLMEDPNNKHLRDEYCNAAGEVIFEQDLSKPMTEEDWLRFEKAFGLDRPIPPEKIRKWESVMEESDEPPKEGPLGCGSAIVSSDDIETLDPGKEPETEKKVAAERRAEKKVAKQPSRRDLMEDGLRQPLHKRRPGYEKRVASMEAEMERVVTEVLVERGSDWYSAGGEIQRVMLTPNLRNLTIYYVVDGEAKDRARKEWRKLNKAMAARIHKEIFERMDIRYVPNVFFERVNDAKTATGNALDAAFAQIEAERLTESSKPV